jgi:hypothetical protein
MSVTPTLANIDPSFITFAASSGNAGTVTVYTTSNTKVDSYMVTITG